MTFSRILLLVLLTVASRAMAMSSAPDFIISFHLQGSAETDSPKSKFQVSVKGQVMTFMKSPEISHENILAFYPFKDKKSGTWGVFLKLDGRGKRKLEIISQSSEGSYLLAMVNAKPVDLVVLDKPITDGALTIWQGVPETVVKAMEKKYRKLTPGKKIPSASDNMDMDPETNAEKKRATADDPTAAADTTPQPQQKSGGGFFGLFKSKPQPKKDQPPQVLNLPDDNSTGSTSDGQPGAAPITSSRIPVEGGGSSTGMASPSLGGGTAPLPSNPAPAPAPSSGSSVRIAPPPPQPKAFGE